METAPTTPRPKMPEKPDAKMRSRSKQIKIIAVAIGALLVILVIFAAGVGIGLHKARFSSDFGKNYERNFMGSRFGDGRGMMGGMMGFLRGFEGKELRNAHGLAGTIISITDNNVVIKDKDNKENTVAVNDQTLIKSQRDNLKLSDLKANDQVVVMGTPGDNGVINASLIRVFNNGTNN